MADRPMSAMTVDASLDGTERLLAQGADGSVILVSGISAYVIDDLVGASEIVPTTGDALLAERSGTEGTIDLDDLAAYAVASAWSVASEADPAVSGDLILANRSGTVYELDIDTIKTFCVSGLQASALDLSALSADTPTGTDLFVFGQAATPKKVTMTNLETVLWGHYQTYVEGLDAVVATADSDLFYTIQGGTPKVLRADDFSTYMSQIIAITGDTSQAAFDLFPALFDSDLSDIGSILDADELYIQRSGAAYTVTMSAVATYALAAMIEFPWTLISPDDYTALAPTTSTLTLSDSTPFAIGRPIKFTWSGVTYYAIITGLTGGQLTIAGAPFSTSVSLSDLYIGPPSHVVTRRIFVPSLVGDTVYNLLETLGRYERWEEGAAYLVSFAGTLGEPDTGAAQPRFNVRVDGLGVSTESAANGPQMSAVAGTWVVNSAVAIRTDRYDIDRAGTIDIRCTAAGTNGDAADLSIDLIFVYE